MVDLENLDRYVMVRVSDQDLSSVEDLRELEGDFGHGVHPLWSDSLNSILAFAFEPALYDQTQAETFVKQVTDKKALSIADVVSAVVAPFARILSSFSRGEERAPESVPSVALVSFDRIVDDINAALKLRYPPPLGNAAYDPPWVVECGMDSVVVRLSDTLQYYVMTYSYADDGTIVLGDPVPAEKSWVTKADGMPVMLHVFTSPAGDGSEALACANDAEKGLIWKEIIHPGRWFKSDSGREVQVTGDMIREAYRAWEAGLPKLISVPADSHHDATNGVVPADANKGFVKRLKLLGDRLFAGFELAPTATQAIEDGTIADVSVYLQPGVVHPTTGERFGWALQHVLLTNNPLAQDLAPFGELPVSASAGAGYVVESYEVRNMSDQNTQQTDQPVGMNADDAALLDAVRGLNLSADDIRAMAQRQAQVVQKARDLEITQIVRAMEGLEDHPGVVQVDGTRHYPVVCQAVEQALRDTPGALSLTANDDGQTGVDSVVIALVNAIPREGRMALTTQPGAPQPQPHTEDDGQPTDAQVTELAERLTPGVRGIAAHVRGV